MMTRSLTLEAAVGVCLLAIALPWPAAGEVSDEEFQALKKDVQKLTQEQQKLAKAHEEDQKKHAEDQQKIQQLQQQLVNEALKAPSQVQPAGGPVSGEEFNSLKSAVDKLSQQYAESTSSPFALQNFMIVGDAETQFAKIQGQHGGFAQFDFAPIFLFRFSDDLLFEAGFDFTLQDNGGYAGAPGGTTYLFDLSFAQLDYVLNQYATLVTGDMLLPLGTYAERSAGWLNKFPDDPFSRAVLPSSGVGAQLRGGGAGGRVRTDDHLCRLCRQRTEFSGRHRQRRPARSPRECGGSTQRPVWESARFAQRRRPHRMVLSLRAESL